jgi:hypothetical protein
MGDSNQPDRLNSKPRVHEKEKDCTREAGGKKPAAINSNNGDDTAEEIRNPGPSRPSASLRKRKARFPSVQLTRSEPSDSDSEYSETCHVDVASAEIESEEALEDELEENLRGDETVKDWGTLRDMAKQQLKKNKNKLTMTQINQLMMISNFATLRLKGFKQEEYGRLIAQQWHHGKGA